MKPEQFEKRLLELGYERGRRDRNPGRGFVRLKTEHDWSSPVPPPYRCRTYRDCEHQGRETIKLWRGRIEVRCAHCKKHLAK